MISHTYWAAIVVILSQVLPLFGVNVSVEALNTTVSTLVAIGAGLWVIKRRWDEGVDALGRRSN